MNRRNFSTTILASAAGTMLSPSLASAAQEASPSICFFTKPLHPLGYKDLAETTAKLGFDGVEATVRPKGHVLPERVEEDLPKLVNALAEKGLKITTMASGINRADGPLTQKILETAVGLGIKRFRMAYYRYDLKRSVARQLEELRPVVQDLAALCESTGIQALYQNHAGGKFVGGPIWDLDSLLGEIDPSVMGVAYDIRHASVEGGESWPISYNLIRPRIGMIYVKDYVWKGARSIHVPLGTGRVPQSFFKKLQKDRANGQAIPPIALHVEYALAKKPADIPKVLEATARDKATLDQWLETP